MKRICPLGSIPYEIKSGDTLGNIAVEFATTVETIIENNPEIVATNLMVGQIICITKPHQEVNCPDMNIYVITRGDTLSLIAKKFGVSVNVLKAANPSLNPNNLVINTIICLPLTPSPYIITIDTTRKQLYLYNLGQLTKSYNVALGKPTTPSPIGLFFIKNKQVNPGGPFGTRWMGLSIPHYGIHGTNQPSSIGNAVSNGCIRLHNHDVEELFNKITINTPVNIY